MRSCKLPTHAKGHQAGLLGDDFDVVNTRVPLMSSRAAVTLGPGDGEGEECLERREAQAIKLSW